MPDDYQKPSFDEAIGFVLEHEGGCTDDPADPGGATQWGVSLRLLQELGYDVDRRRRRRRRPTSAALTSREAVAMFRSEWWDRYDYGSLGTQLVAEKVFDLAVNMGPAQAHRLLQRALRASRRGESARGRRARPADLDGGPAADPWATRAALRSEAAGFYRLLAAQKPSLAVFLTGWLRRAYW